MIERFSSGACVPSCTAAFHAPVYHAQLMPFAESVSPIVFVVCGGSVWRAGSVKRGSPPFAGGTADGWYGGCVVLTDQPSGVTSPPVADSSPPIALAGESGLRF